MVAKISTPNSMLAALNYNENKVKMSKAICLHAEGFLLDTNELSFTQKAKGFERLNERNETAKTKTLHISLNFDPSEKLSETKLKILLRPISMKLVLKTNPIWFINTTTLAIRTSTSSRPQSGKMELESIRTISDVINRRRQEKKLKQNSI